MNPTNPAIVAQNAVRRLPRWALLLLCAAYLLPGFVGRAPWKNADLAAFGFMSELAGAAPRWLAPRLLGEAPEAAALLPYWLGAWALRLAPSWIAPDFAVRIPFIGLLALALAATWYAVYYLARNPQAQPVAFAFGGEANPADYARAIADAGLLALVACLGLAQLSHETTPALAQLAFAALALYGAAALRRHPVRGAVGLAIAGVGLTLCGAPAMSLVMLCGAAAVAWLRPETETADARHHRAIAAVVAASALACAVLAWALELWQWRVALPDGITRSWRSVGRLLLWFTWPAWPLALWTLWRWRHRLSSGHVALPLGFAGIALAAAIATPSGDRALLLGLPALAALAAFALPTLTRSVAALVDWFTLLFFSICALLVWLVWTSMHLGWPPKPATAIAKLLPGFAPSFSLLATSLAVAATLGWAWVVYWRAGRHRPAIWKSLVLPAAGATLNWVLLTTLGLPVLDFARSYAPLVHNTVRLMDQPGCVEVFGLSQAQIAAFRHHGGLDLRRAARPARCGWLIADNDDTRGISTRLDMRQWTLRAEVPRPGDSSEVVALYRRRAGR